MAAPEDIRFDIAGFQITFSPAADGRWTATVYGVRYELTPARDSAGEVFAVTQIRERFARPVPIGNALDLQDAAEVIWSQHQ